MAEHERAKQGKHEEVDKKHRTKQQEAQPSFDQSLTWDTGPFSLTETPFHPRMDEHAAILSRIPFSAQRHEFIMRLHQTYGSSYIQRLVNSVNAQAKLTVSNPNDVYEQEADTVATEVTKAINYQTQRQTPEEEKELLQGKSLVQRQVPEEELQMQASEIERSKAINKENRTGMPDSLKTSIENVSGIAMDDVKVHYNSAKPAEVQALAYTQGSDIYVAPGQEFHLPHEAWHVVQQKKGGVKADAQIRGYEVNIDSKLEEEADIMGAKASNLISVESRLPTASQSEKSRQLLGQTLNTAQRNSYGVPVRQFICGFGKKATRELAESAPPDVIKIIDEETTAEEEANPREIGAGIVGKLGLEPMRPESIVTYLKPRQKLDVIRKVLPTMLYHPTAQITLYHATLTENVESILAQGLLPSKGGEGGANGLVTEPLNALGYVYLTTTPRNARDAARNFFPKGSITVLEVTLGTDIVLVQDPDLASAVRTTSTLENVKKYEAST